MFDVFVNCVSSLIYDFTSLYISFFLKIGFLIIELEKIQYILDTSSWSDICLANIFAKCVACFFIFNSALNTKVLYFNEIQFTSF